MFDLVRPTRFPDHTVWPQSVDPDDLTEIRSRWLRHIGLPAAEHDAASAKEAHAPSRTVETVETATHTRRRMTYQTERGITTEAYLLEPKGLRARAPGIVLLHPTTRDSIDDPAGITGPASGHSGVQLVEQGYVVLCPEDFLWNYQGRRTELTGDWGRDFAGVMERLGEDHPDWTGMAKMLHDARRAVDVLADQPGVDPKRLGCVGVSLGAKQGLYLSAFDKRIGVTVAIDGGIGLPYGLWEAPCFLGEQVRRLPGDHHEVLALAAPCAFLLIGSTGGMDEDTGQYCEGFDGERSWPYFQAALPAWAKLGVADRVGMLNHRHGHTIPAVARRATLEWFARWL